MFGIIPALIWLWFWLKEDIHPESAKMITLSFIGGALAVFLALPVQQFFYPYVVNNNLLAFSVFAAIEELLKFGTVYCIALRNKNIDDEPVDNIIYMLISALGFVALENTLFLVTPIASGNIISSIISDNMRFIGASLLHVISSGTIGIFMGFAFYKAKNIRKIYTIIGIMLAIVLHVSFNLFIINEPDNKIYIVFASVWLGVIILLSLIEKVKKIKNPSVL